MLELKKGVDILTEVGRVKTIDEARAMTRDHARRVATRAKERLRDLGAERPGLADAGVEHRGFDRRVGAR